MNRDTLTSLLIFSGLFVKVSLVSVRLSNAGDARRYGQGQHTITIEYHNGRDWHEESPDPGQGQTEALGNRKVRSVKIVSTNGAQEDTCYDRSEMRQG